MESANVLNQIIVFIIKGAKLYRIICAFLICIAKHLMKILLTISVEKKTQICVCLNKQVVLMVLVYALPIIFAKI